MCGAGTHGTTLEQRILRINPILEAFGNAQTLMNDNSSRFGKYMAVQYDLRGGICGAATETYLLERSRVVAVEEGERNYHIFYQLLTDASASSWGLGDASTVGFLSHEGAVAQLSSGSDAKAFAELTRALGAFGFTEAQREATWRVLSAVLLLGNVRFVAEHESAKPIVGGGRTTPGKTPPRGKTPPGKTPPKRSPFGKSGKQTPPHHASLGNEPATIANGEALASAARALGVDAARLRTTLLSKRMLVAKESIVQPLTARAAAQTRDAMAKRVYATLFDSVVDRLNGASAADSSSSSAADSSSATHSIGILDVFGFERLQTNSFEQESRALLQRISAFFPHVPSSPSTPLISHARLSFYFWHSPFSACIPPD